MITKLLLIALMVGSLALGASGQAPKPQPKDARLDKKVTCEARGIPLRLIVANLAEKTGVDLRCGVNLKDWQVRDRKMVIFAKDVPLGKLQENIATLMHFSWERTQKNGVYTYRIVQDAKSKKAEEALRDEGPAAREKKLAANREKLVGNLEKLGSMTPDDLAKLKKDDPFLYIIEKEKVGTSIAGMLRALPEARDALTQGKEFTVKLSDAPESVQSAAAAFVRGMGNLESKLSPAMGLGAGQGEDFSGLEANIADATLRINPYAEAMTGSGFEAGQFGMLGMISVHAESKDEKQPMKSADVPLFDPTTGIGKMMGRMAEAVDSGKPLDQAAKEMEGDSKELISEIMGGGEPDEPLPDDPELAKKIKLEVEVADKSRFGASQADIMAALSKKCDLQIVSDYFPRAFDFFGGAVEKEGTVGSVLKSIGGIYGKRLKKTGSIVTLEDKKWAEKRGWQVPDLLLDRWKALGKKGKLTLDDLVDMANLSDPQIDNGLKADELLMGTAFSLSEDRHILRFYSTLSGEQKHVIRTPDGLVIAGLPAEQQAAFETAMSKHKGSASFTGGSMQYKKPEEIRPDSKLVMRLDGDEENKFYNFLLEDWSTIDNSPPEPEPSVDSIDEPPTLEDGDTAPPAEAESAVEPDEAAAEEPVLPEGPRYLKIAEWFIHIPSAEEFEPPKMPTIEDKGAPDPSKPGADAPAKPAGKK